MATTVIHWISKDEKIFNTKEQADAWDEALEVLSHTKEYIGSGAHQQFLLRIAVAEILEFKTLVKRPISKE